MSLLQTKRASGGNIKYESLYLFEFICKQYQEYTDLFSVIAFVYAPEQNKYIVKSDGGTFNRKRISPATMGDSLTGYGKPC